MRSTRPIVLLAIERAVLSAQPYEWALLDGVLEPAAAERLAEMFPTMGFVAGERVGTDKPYRLQSRPVLPGDAAPSPSLAPEWIDLAGALRSDAYRQAMERLTGVNLDATRHELILWRYDAGCWLAPHCDKPEKVVSHVLYFNRSWHPSWGGCLQILRSGNADDVAANVIPSLGTSVVIVRSDRSWHAVAPVAGGPPDVARLSLTSVFYQPSQRV